MNRRNFRHALDSVDQHCNAQLPQNQNQRGPRDRQPKMRARVHDVIGPTTALERVAHFRNFGVIEFVRRAGQAVRAANLLHRFRGDREHPVRDREQDHLLGWARAPRFPGFLRSDLHRASTGTRRASFATRLSIAALIASRLRTSFTTPVLIASAGIPKITELASSCAIT